MKKCIAQIFIWQCYSDIRISWGELCISKKQSTGPLRNINYRAIGEEKANETGQVMDIQM